MLDGVKVTDADVKHASQMVVNNQVSLSLFNAAWCPGARSESAPPPPWLNLKNYAQVLFSYTKIKPKGNSASKVLFAFAETF